MAPLNPNSTARLLIHYSTCGFDHTALIRLGAGETAEDGAAEFNELITAAGALFYESNFVGADYAASGSDIFNPVDATWPVSWGEDVGPNSATANYVDWIGRSLDGRRGRFSLFGCTVDEYNGKYRILASENAVVNASLEVLDGAEGTFVTINGFQPVWKRYVNIGVNAHWRNKIR